MKRTSCSNHAELRTPIGGFFYSYVSDIEAEGGLSVLNAFLPAAWSISRWATNKWPNCDTERKRLGYPKIGQKDDGTFGWEKPCPKCQ